MALLLTAGSTAQQRVGVWWQNPAESPQSVEQLDHFSDLGGSSLIIDADLQEAAWGRIDSLGFGVYGNLPITYPTVSTFTNLDSTLLNEISSGINQFIAQPSVQAIGIFSLGQSRSKRFKRVLQPVIQEIDTTISARLYYTSLYSGSIPADSLFDFKLLKVNSPEVLSVSERSAKVKGYIYDVSHQLLSPVKRLLEQAKADSIPVFFEGNWLIKTTKKHPEFEKALSHYAATGEIIFPLPKEKTPGQSGHNSIIVLMLLILGAFVLNYQYSPIYKKTISRYFLAHKFLVKDIMDRHIRIISPALVILFQHIVATGIVMYCLGNVVITQVGWEAVQYHYPEFFISQSSLISLFFGGCLFSFVTHLISILWIRLTNKKATHFSQVILLYSWPLQINLILTLLIVTLMVSGPFTVLIYVFTALFMIIFLGAFIITAFDTSNYLTSRRIGFLLASAGIYSTIWITLGVWIFSNDYLLDVLSLAVSLP